MNRTLYIVALFAVLSLCFLPGKGEAHPHLFLTNSIEAVFDTEGLKGFQTAWVADEFSTAGLLDGYDENEDGKVDRQELDIFEEESMDHLKSVGYFSSIHINGKPFKVKEVKDFSATLTAERLTYRFFIPCRVTAEKTFRELTIAQYDTTYYSYIGFEKERPVAVTKPGEIELTHKIAENKNETYYFGQLHPIAWILRFKKK